MARQELVLAGVVFASGFLCAGAASAETPPTEELAGGADANRATMTSVGPGNLGRSQLPKAPNHPMAQSYSNLPLSFESNQGQKDPQVKFLSRGERYTLFLTSTGAVLTFQQPSAGSTAFRMTLVGANPSPQVTGLEELPGKSNYFVGNDPERWRTHVPNYAKVRYQGVYAGIDLFFYGSEEGQLEYDFVLAPGASPATIRLAFDGPEEISLDDRGNLLLALGDTQVVQRAPTVYQEIDGVRQAIEGGYALCGKNQVCFDVNEYDVSKKLILDPIVLSYASYLGGSENDRAEQLAVDSSGNIYVVGSTNSPNFPVSQPIQSMLVVASDAFVAKLDPTGSTLLYSTFLGGSSYDNGFAIAVGAEGSAYITGLTASSNFPTSAAAFQGFFRGNEDVFVTKLNADGSALVYSTYLGGTGFDEGFVIAVDAAGSAYVTGSTDSANFPQVNPFQSRGTGENGFVTKLDPAGAVLLYSSYLGGNGGEFGNALHVDAQGQAYVAGPTGSTNLPTTPGAFQSTFGGGPGDAYLVKVSPDGSSLLYSTYLGGSGADKAYGVLVDAAGDIFVAGETTSLDFPVVNPLQAANAGAYDAFVTEFKSDGSVLLFSTYLGGSSNDRAFGLAVDDSGSSYITGRTHSPNFPTVNPLQGALAGSSDALVAKLDPSGSQLVFSTYLGGSGEETGFRPVVSNSRRVYIAGRTNSTNFPTANPLQATSGGQNDVFIAILTELLDDFARATVIQELPFTDTTDTSQATSETGDPTPSCGNGSRGKSIWYRFTPSSPGTVTADTFGSSYNTILSVWTGSPGAFAEVACNDDADGNVQSRVSFSAAGETTYSFMMSAFNNDGGTLVFNLDFQEVLVVIPIANFQTIIPHSASGGGFLTRLFISNLTENTNALTIHRIDQNGTVVEVTTTTLQPAATFLLADSEDTRTEGLTIAWYALGSDLPIAASILFDFDSESLGLEDNFRTSVGALAAEPLTAFTLPVRVATEEVTVGMALVNLSDAPNQITMKLLDHNGAVVAQDSLSLGPFEQTAFSLQDRNAFRDIVLAVTEFIGALAVTTDDPNTLVSAMVVGNNLRQLFSLPVASGVAH